MQSSFSQGQCKNDILLISKCRTANSSLYKEKRQKIIKNTRAQHSYQNSLEDINSSINLNKKSVIKLKMNNKQNKINQLIVQFKNKQPNISDFSNQQTELKIQYQKQETRKINIQQKLTFNLKQQKQKITDNLACSKQNKKSLNIKIKSLLVPENWKIKNSNGFQKNHKNNKSQMLKKFSVLKKQQEQLIKKFQENEKFVQSQNKISFANHSKNYKLNKCKRDKIMFQNYKQSNNQSSNFNSQTFYSKIKIDFQPQTPYLKNYLKTYSSKSLIVKSISRSASYLQKLFEMQRKNKQNNLLNVSQSQLSLKNQKHHTKEHNKTFHHTCQQKNKNQTNYNTCLASLTQQNSIKSIHKYQNQQFSKYDYGQIRNNDKKIESQTKKIKRRQNNQRLTTKLQPWANKFDNCQAYELQL